jgi:hypothetical protein
METITAYKCGFCPKMNVKASRIKKHEEICFFNTKTMSCATCLWFSPLIIEFSDPTRCFIGKIKEVPEGSKMVLNTQCPDWMDQKVYFDHETCENDDEMEEKLVSGDIDYFKTLENKKI